MVLTHCLGGRGRVAGEAAPGLAGRAKGKAAPWAGEGWRALRRSSARVGARGRKGAVSLGSVPGGERKGVVPLVSARRWGERCPQGSVAEGGCPGGAGGQARCPEGGEEAVSRGWLPERWQRLLPHGAGGQVRGRRSSDWRTQTGSCCRLPGLGPRGSGLPVPSAPWPRLPAQAPPQPGPGSSPGAGSDRTPVPGRVRWLCAAQYHLPTPASRDPLPPRRFRLPLAAVRPAGHRQSQHATGPPCMLGLAVPTGGRKTPHQTFWDV